MNCEKFDEVIKIAFFNYGQFGVKVELLSVEDKATPTPPGNWYSVSVKVEPVTTQPDPVMETWYYGGVIRHETRPVPLGIRPINKDKLIGACKAAEQLPVGFPLPEASANLSWPLTPLVDEPLYTFYHDDISISVGAYSGQVKK
ncbi:MAG TPA: hypothetical protein VK184_15285 [Nostocaceae cyanobacterium]|nr:hypothetical protein [Nostocaceae cyanobacterium]